MSKQTVQEIKSQLSELREFIEDKEGTETEKRIAYAIECAVRFTIEDVDWNDGEIGYSFIKEAKEAAELIEAN